jgi:hydroxymethylbilane synthase
MTPNTTSHQYERPIIVGTRGSQLALAQTNWVINQLARQHPHVEIQIRTVHTQGDIQQTASLSQIGGTGVFVKEIESALLSGEIDLAVHSMKDLPIVQPAGLVIGAVCPREDPRDVFISARKDGLDELPAGSTVGTGSLRRKAQLLAYRSDLIVQDIRGNVDTRLRKVSEGQCDAVILAAAGLKRLGHVIRADQYLPLDIMLPAVGQGALALEIRSGDPIATFLETINDPATQTATQAEMAFLAAFGGGCAVPIGAYADVDADLLTLQGLVSSLDGKTVLHDRMTGPVQDPEALGQALAQTLLDRGAGEIIDTLFG